MAMVIAKQQDFTRRLGCGCENTWRKTSPASTLLMTTHITVLWGHGSVLFLNRPSNVVTRRHHAVSVLWCAWVTVLVTCDKKKFKREKLEADFNDPLIQEILIQAFNNVASTTKYRPACETKLGFCRSWMGTLANATKSLLFLLTKAINSILSIHLLLFKFCITPFLINFELQQ